MLWNPEPFNSKYSSVLTSAKGHKISKHILRNTPWKLGNKNSNLEANLYVSDSDKIWSIFKYLSVILEYAICSLCKQIRKFCSFLSAANLSNCSLTASRKFSNDNYNITIKAMYESLVQSTILHVMSLPSVLESYQTLRLLLRTLLCTLTPWGTRGT